MDAWELINSWWKQYDPYAADPTKIESGKRAPLASGNYITYPGGVVQKVTKGNRQTGYVM